MSIVVGGVIGIICAVVCWVIAGQKGRSQVLWAILGFLFSIISLIVLLILPSHGSRQTA